MTSEFSAQNVIQKLDNWTAKWHRQDVDLGPETHDPEGFFRWVHYNNFRLWHTEDEARREDVADAYIVRCKRDIDVYNQQRNDGIEKIDMAIDVWLRDQKINTPPEVPSNSETPGSIIDRLSILSLKIYHMQEETVRTDVVESHISKAHKKLAILGEQRRDLGTALDALIDALFRGEKRHKLYFQFKMYNDPETNQAIYKR